MNLKKLISEVEKINNNSINKELRNFWNDFYSLKEEYRIPINITLTMAFFAKNLDINLIEHYEKPEKYVLSKETIDFRDHPNTNIKFTKSSIEIIVILIDAAEVFLMINPKADLVDSAAIWSNNASLIIAMNTCFEALWEKT